MGAISSQHFAPRRYAVGSLTEACGKSGFSRPVNASQMAKAMVGSRPIKPIGALNSESACEERQLRNLLEH